MRPFTATPQEEKFPGAETAQLTTVMIDVPAARFEDAATEQGSRGILHDVGDFVETYGVDPIGRGQIEHTLAAILGAVAGHASTRPPSRIAVVADVMPGDVQLVLRLCSGDRPLWEEDDEPVGGLELWISFPRDCPPPGLLDLERRRRPYGHGAA